MKTYYSESGVRIIHGDCREILPQISAEAIITDPVWPNASRLLTGHTRAWELFGEICTAIPACVDRMVVQIGCNSDPRFLGAVPVRLPFFRVCWLSLVPCHFRGRVLYSGDVAYAFGEPPIGTGIIPGECCSNEKGIFMRHGGRNRNQRVHEATEAALPHPAARKLAHVRWLAKHFAGASVCDPFGGSGTTAVACKALGVPCILIEIEERFCEIAVMRLRQESLDLQETGKLEMAGGAA